MKLSHLSLVADLALLSVQIVMLLCFVCECVASVVSAYRLCQDWKMEPEGRRCITQPRTVHLTGGALLLPTMLLIAGIQWLRPAQYAAVSPLILLTALCATAGAPVILLVAALARTIAFWRREAD